jgi:hypothetical protein
MVTAFPIGEKKDHFPLEPLHLRSGIPCYRSSDWSKSSEAQDQAHKLAEANAVAHGQHADPSWHDDGETNQDVVGSPSGRERASLSQPSEPGRCADGIGTLLHLVT